MFKRYFSIILLIFINNCDLPNNPIESQILEILDIYKIYRISGISRILKVLMNSRISKILKNCKFSNYTARLPFWSTKRHDVATKLISYERYGEILFQKVASGHLLHFVQDGSSKNAL